jgi:hypothetical protein
MVKVTLCDLCIVQEEKISLATHSGRIRSQLGDPVKMCKKHSKGFSKFARDSEAVKMVFAGIEGGNFSPKIQSVIKSL